MDNTYLLALMASCQYGATDLRTQILNQQTNLQCATLEMQLDSLRQQVNAYGVTEIYGGCEVRPIGYIHNNYLTKTNCVNCGAPLKRHLCEYCGTNNI